jgi:hypothetical protein
MSATRRVLSVVWFLFVACVIVVLDWTIADLARREVRLHRPPLTLPTHARAKP